MSANPKYGDGDLPYGLTVAEDGAYLDWRGEHYTRTIERAPEPGADILDEVVEAACRASGDDAAQEAGR